jgi:putative transposase
MVRIACVTMPDLPHPVTQRGNRRGPVFHEDGDCTIHRDLFAAACAAFRRRCRLTSARRRRHGHADAIASDH